MWFAFLLVQTHIKEGKTEIHIKYLWNKRIKKSWFLHSLKKYSVSTRKTSKIRYCKILKPLQKFQLIISSTVEVLQRRKSLTWANIFYITIYNEQIMFLKIQSKLTVLSGPCQRLLFYLCKKSESCKITFSCFTDNFVAENREGIINGEHPATDGQQEKDLRIFFSSNRWTFRLCLHLVQNYY